jgi:hypothetical protein
MAEQRIKEIGVRGVSACSQLMGIAVEDFVGLAIISLIFAVPLSIISWAMVGKIFIPFRLSP